jgi:hypothetical protein
MDEEEADFYKRIGGGPVAIARGPDKEPPNPKPRRRSPAKRHRS